MATGTHGEFIRDDGLICTCKPGLHECPACRSWRSTNRCEGQKRTVPTSKRGKRGPVTVLMADGRVVRTNYPLTQVQAVLRCSRAGCSVDTTLDETGLDPEVVRYLRHIVAIVEVDRDLF